MLHTLVRNQMLPVGIDEAWAFFSNPANLRSITPDWLCFDMTCPPPSTIHPGQIFTYTITPFAGIAVDWVTEITHVVEPKLFVDEQRFGPYRFWHHQHHFERKNGGTHMMDIVNYALPLGWLGDIIESLIVRPRLRAIFEFRKDALECTFKTNGTHGPKPLGKVG
ncbi:ligand-binding SRPBCC domain-containing protein [Desulfobaculum xiamenense]|uniref:Ligand-binding SRPBCC domain-containing protein n=1 Tax=Desulfobaculum xiamenense TaxID=995050 RepID=A0A846QD17_9BACT|nr:SRPBCC family protein [Desulfobaculum xiamenense]NJB66616.1 ligand-binding SRPBCC domain-containing protein [Desulfobaculum xiamenense]